MDLTDSLTGCSESDRQRQISRLIPLIYKNPPIVIEIKERKDLSKITREQRQAVLESKTKVERYTNFI